MRLSLPKSSLFCFEGREQEMFLVDLWKWDCRGLSGQCSFPRAREASQEVEVFPKAVAARRCSTRGRRSWRPRRLRRLLLLLLLPEAQPPKGFKKTLLHGVGAGGGNPAFPFLKSRSWPKLLFLWLSGHVIDVGAGARSPAPPSHPPEPRCVGGVVPTWKAGDAGRLTATKTSATDLHSPPTAHPHLQPSLCLPAPVALPPSGTLGTSPGSGRQAFCKSPTPSHRPLGLESEIILVDEENVNSILNSNSKNHSLPVCEHQYLAGVPMAIATLPGPV